MSNGSFSTTPQERYLEDYVEGVRVNKKYRGQGIGKRLFK